MNLFNIDLCWHKKPWDFLVKLLTLLHTQIHMLHIESDLEAQKISNNHKRH